MCPTTLRQSFFELASIEIEDDQHLADSRRAEGRSSNGFSGSEFKQSQADFDGLVHPLHALSGQPPQPFLQAQPVHRPDLVDNDGRTSGQTAVRGFDHDLPGKRRIRELGTDGGHDGDRAVLVGDVVLDDNSRSSLLDFVSDSRIKSNQVNLAATREGYFFLFLPWATCHASSSKGNHSAAICRSRSALARASCFNRSRRFCRPWVST